MSYKLAKSALFLCSAVFKNPVCKVYRFQTTDSKWMLVREQMAECTLSFSIPIQLLRLYIQEDRQRYVIIHRAQHHTTIHPHMQISTRPDRRGVDMRWRTERRRLSSQKWRKRKRGKRERLKTREKINEALTEWCGLCFLQGGCFKDGNGCLRAILSPH